MDTENLIQFYETVKNLTIHHGTINDIAAVLPIDLGHALEKVDPEWFKIKKGKTMSDKKITRIKIGSCHTYQTALMCTRYLSELFGIEFELAQDDVNPYHPYMIFYYEYNLNQMHDLPVVEVCRAFVAGRGEVWA